MSDEGVRLVSRVALLVVIILATAAFRAMVGPGKQRGRIVGVGTIGGMALGIAAASKLSEWFGSDVSAPSVLVGVVIGWGVSWLFAKRIPREAL